MSAGRLSVCAAAPLCLQTGFLDDWRRANVALSRARRALVVVGHRGTLRGSSTWKAFLEHTAQQGCLVKLEQLKMLKRVA